MTETNTTPTSETTEPVQLECERCAHCAEKAEQLLEMAEQLKLVDDNDRSTQIMDLIVHLRHRYDQLPEAERSYASWQDVVDSVAIHYEAEAAGEDCGEECEKHAELVEADDDDDEGSRG